MSNKLKNKMYNYAVVPPEKTWEKISAALDDSALSNEFPSTLYNLEAIPPANTWEKIKASLEAGQTTITPRRKIVPLLRFAAAAVFIGVIALAGMRLLKGKTGENRVAVQNKISPTKLAAILPDKIPIAVTKTHPTNRSSNHLPGKNTSSTDQLVRNNTKSPTDNYSGEPTVLQNTIESSDPEPLHEVVAVEQNTAHSETALNNGSDYVMFMTPEGKMIRMSKKLENLLCCVSGEEQDAGCKDQLQHWREKIACSPVTASPGNFMDIFSLVNSLQENSD